MASIGQFFAIGGMIIGGIIGTFLGGNTYAGAMIGGAIGGLIGAYFFPEGPKMKDVQPPEPGENRVQISTYGGMLPMVWGAKRVAGNVIWMDDVVETYNRSRHRMDGVRYYENERLFTASFAVAICAGPVREVLRIWVNNELFVDFREDGDPYYTATDDTAGNLDESSDLYGIYYTLYLGSESQTADPTMEAALGSGNVPGYRGVCYIVFKDFPVGKFGAVPTVEAEVIKTTQADPATDELFSQIATDICGEVDIAAANIDLTDFASDAIAGYMVPRQMPARTALEPIMQAMKCDVAEIDWKLHFVKRNLTSVATITNDEIGAYDEQGDRAEIMTINRIQDAELPTHLILNFESRARDYDTSSANAIRIDKEQYLPMTISFGIVMTEATAKQLAEIMLKTLWSARSRFRFTTTNKYLFLAPSNTIVVSGQYMRIIEMTDRNGVIEFTCEGQDAGSYESEAEHDDVSRPPISLTADDIVPNVIFMDSAYFYDTDNSVGFYVAFYGESGAFSGGALRVSHDDGYSWTTIAYADSESAIVGEMGEAFDGSSFNVDLTISNQTLTSEADLIALIGSEANGWEIIQFDTATLVSGNTYTISDITRGINGTTKTHSSGEYFILMTDAVSIDKVFIEDSDIGVTLLYQNVSRSGYGSETPIEFALSGTYTP